MVGAIPCGCPVAI